MQSKGFIAALFDFSFKEFITVHWIKLIFGVVILAGAWVPFAGIVFFLTQRNLVGFLAAGFSALLYLAVVVFARIGLESIMVVFRMEEHLRGLAEKSRM